MGKTTFRGYNRVKFQSLKLGKTVFCQSLILRDFLIHLEWDDSVTSYELKPFKISIKTSGKRRIITPHVLVHCHNQTKEIIWLKFIETDDSDYSYLIKPLTTFCKSKGFNFALKFSSEIRKEPLFSNLKFLRKYERTVISTEHSNLCREFFSKDSLPTFGNLIQFFNERNQSREIPYALVSKKIVESDIYSAPINFDSQIELKNEFSNFQNGRLAA